jgi:hypothetical protein
MPRTTHRPRREVDPQILRKLSPVMRFSSGRQAYVLRGVGGRFGPVLVPRAERRPERDHQHA